MQSTKPYLIRAIHEWCIDQGFTPYLSVSTDGSTRVPQEFVKDGAIVLNVGLDATNQLELGNDEISFQARFSGRVFPVLVPICRVSAIYARENGQGMAFDVTDSGDEASAKEPSGRAKPEARAPGLQIAASSSPPEDDNDGGGKGGPAAGRSHLTRVK